VLRQAPSTQTLIQRAPTDGSALLVSRPLSL
jgi:hypothetical protein